MTAANVGSSAAATALGLARVRLYKDALPQLAASWEEGLRQLAMSGVVGSFF